MVSVWVIEEGEYSDYRVVGVFSSKGNAELLHEAFKKANEYYSGEINEWPLDPGVNELRLKRKMFRCLMCRDGEVETICEDSLETYGHLVDRYYIWRREEAPAYRGQKDKPNVLDASVWARDEKHAVKIVNEKRTQMIANGEW